jgi:shikimate kinase
VLLIGFMGSGKTRVGRSLARRLGWVFVDFDDEIASRVGLPIPAIFSQHGEEYFRKVEAEVGAELLQGVQQVLASGGGWPVQPGRMEGLTEDTFSVWLKVTPEEVLRRAGSDGPTRPLLDVGEPLERVRKMLAERERFYMKAHTAIDTVGADPEELAMQIEEAIEEKGRNLLRSLPPHE